MRVSLQSRWASPHLLHFLQHFQFHGLHIELAGGLQLAQRCEQRQGLVFSSVDSHEGGACRVPGRLRTAGLACAGLGFSPATACWTGRAGPERLIK